MPERKIKHTNLTEEQFRKVKAWLLENRANVDEPAKGDEGWFDTYGESIVGYIDEGRIEVRSGYPREYISPNRSILEIWRNPTPRLTLVSEGPWWYWIQYGLSQMGLLEEAGIVRFSEKSVRDAQTS